MPYVAYAVVLAVLGGAGAVLWTGQRDMSPILAKSDPPPVAPPPVAMAAPAEPAPPALLPHLPLPQFPLPSRH